MWKLPHVQLLAAGVQPHSVLSRLPGESVGAKMRKDTGEDEVKTKLRDLGAGMINPVHA